MKKKFCFKHLFSIMFLAAASVFGTLYSTTSSFYDSKVAEAKNIGNDSDTSLLVRIFTEPYDTSGNFANSNYRCQLQIYGSYYDSTKSTFFNTATQNNWNDVYLNGSTHYWYQEITIDKRNYLNKNSLWMYRKDPSYSSAATCTKEAHPGTWNLGYDMCTYDSSDNKKTATGNSIYFSSADMYTVVSKGLVYKIRLMAKSTIGGSYTQHTCALYDSNTSYTFPTTGIPTPNGYSFAGWYTNESCTTSAGSSLKPQTDTELYAKYTPNSYTISYVANKGLINDSSYPTSYTVGTGATLPTNVTRDGHSFAGWKINSDLSGDSYTQVSTTDYGNKTFYAKWNHLFIGGEVFYLIDKPPAFYQGDGAQLRIYVRDESGHFKVSDKFNEVIYRTDNTWDTYRIVIPDYTGPAGGGWTHFELLRINPAGDGKTDSQIYNSYVWDKSTTQNTYDWYYYSEWCVDSYGSSKLNISKVNKTALYGAYVGNTMYFEMGSWDKKGYTGYMAVYFFGYIGGADKSGTYSAWVLLDNSKRVYGTGSDYTGGLWEFTIPAPSQDANKKVHYHNYIVVQLKEGVVTPSFDGDKVQYKSSDLSFTNTYNIIKGDSAMDYEFQDLSRAFYFSTYFLEQTSEVCHEDGSTAPASLSTAWSNVTNQKPLRSGAVKWFKTSQGKISGSTMEQAAKRYDYITGKYTTAVYADFMGRVSGGHYSYPAPHVVEPFTVITGIEDESSGVTLVIVVAVVASVSILSLSTLLIVKKKRQQTDSIR